MRVWSLLATVIRPAFIEKPSLCLMLNNQPVYKRLAVGGRGEIAVVAVCGIIINLMDAAGAKDVM